MLTYIIKQMEIYFKGDKPKLIDKEVLFGFWKKISASQKISFLLMMVLMLALPVGMLMVANPKKPITTPASSPVTPPVNITPIPPELLSANWITPQVYLEARYLNMSINGKHFWENPENVIIHSDPGDSNYTTLEMTWYENGVEMRINMYFRSDGQKWWLDELRSYNGQDLGDWIYYDVAYYGGSKFIERPLEEPYIGTLSFYSKSNQEYSGIISFTEMVLLPFEGAVNVTPSPPPPCIFGIPMLYINPTSKMGYPGQELRYTITLSTRDNSYECDNWLFRFDISNIPGWYTDLDLFGINFGEVFAMRPKTSLVSSFTIRSPFENYNYGEQSFLLTLTSLNHNYQTNNSIVYNLVPYGTTATPTPSMRPTNTPTIMPTPYIPTNTPTPTPPPPNDVPTFGSRLPKVGLVGRNYKSRVIAYDVNGNNMFMHAINLPPGLELTKCANTNYKGSQSRIACDVSGKPLVSGYYRSYFSVVDERGGVAYQAISFLILPWFK
jgi:hypothetical protein